MDIFFAYLILVYALVSAILGWVSAMLLSILRLSHFDLTSFWRAVALGFALAVFLTITLGFASHSQQWIATLPEIAVWIAIAVRCAISHTRDYLRFLDWSLLGGFSAAIFLLRVVLVGFEPVPDSLLQASCSAIVVLGFAEFVCSKHGIQENRKSGHGV
jgi:hypothetical protein